MKKPVSLELLNSLIKELNKQMSVVDQIDAKTFRTDHLVELSKAIGLISAINSESLMLLGDIGYLSKPPSVGEDLLSSLLDAKKKPDFQ